MIRLNEETNRAISSLRRTAQFNKFVQYLEEEFEYCVKGLMTADADNVQRLQGKTKFIQELLEVVNKED